MRRGALVSAAILARAVRTILPLPLMYGLTSCRNFDGLIEHDTTVTLQQGTSGYTGTADCHVLEWAPDNNTGGNDSLEVCRFPQNQANDDKYGLVRFDLSSIPTDVEILRAVLQVYFVGVRNGTAAKTMNCHRVTGFWDEGNQLGLDGQIGPGVTWNLRPGYDATLLDSQTLGAATNSWHGFDITPAVIMWLEGSAQNYGVLLKPAVSDGAPLNAAGTKQLASSEHTTPSIRPRLTVTYRQVMIVE